MIYGSRALLLPPCPRLFQLRDPTTLAPTPAPTLTKLVKAPARHPVGLALGPFKLVSPRGAVIPHFTEKETESPGRTHCPKSHRQGGPSPARVWYPIPTLSVSVPPILMPWPSHLNLTLPSWLSSQDLGTDSENNQADWVPVSMLYSAGVH